MQAPAPRLACELRAVSLPRTPATRGHARTRQAAAGRVPAAGSGRAAACRQAWTHAGWHTPQRPPRGARSGARRGAGLSQRHRALAGIWPCEFPFPQLGSRNFGLRKGFWSAGRIPDQFGIGRPISLILVRAAVVKQGLFGLAALITRSPHRVAHDLVGRAAGLPPESLGMSL